MLIIALGEVKLRLCWSYLQTRTSKCFRVYNSGQKSLGHLEKADKRSFSSTYCHSCCKNAPSSPLEQCWFACGTLEVGVHAKFFHYRMYFSKKSTLFQGRGGGKFIAEYKKCKVSQDFWRLLYVHQSVDNART